MIDFLQSRDLILKPAYTALAKGLLDYYLRNKAFLESFEPRRDDEFFTHAHHFASLEREIQQAEQNCEFHYYIARKSNPDEIIGTISLSNVVWGCFCSCFLGYKLDCGFLRRGYMTQAVEAVTQMAFTQLNLHRIEANVMPRNTASLGVLQKCGFEHEGVAKKYLKINGVWEDHIHMVKLNETTAPLDKKFQ